MEKCKCSFRAVFVAVLCSVFVIIPSIQVVLSMDSSQDYLDIKAVINDEVEGAIAQEIDLLQSLYDRKAKVIDHNGTPNNDFDNRTFEGWDMIKNRYEGFFASYNWKSMSLVGLEIKMDGRKKATGEHKGTIGDGNYREDRAKYTLKKVRGSWLITKLEYNKFQKRESDHSNDYIDIKAIIDAEVKGTLDKDLDLLRFLYSSSANVIDRSDTPNNLLDDIDFNGWSEIKDRYTAIFYYYNWNSLSLVDLEIILESKTKATVKHQGTIGNGVYRKDRSIYTLEKKDERWLITMLEYNKIECKE